MSETKDAATPWTMTLDPWHAKLLDADGIPMGFIHTRAKAEFVLRAVNSHAALLAACVHAQRVIRGLLECPGAQHERTDATLAEPVIRAAIKLAKEGGE